MPHQNRKITLIFGWVFLLAALVVGGCSDKADYSKVAEISGGPAFDPSKPVEVTDFIPKSGGVGTRLVIYGNNFGNDTTKIKVTIGGKNAKVINTMSTSLLCVVPEKAFDGDIKVSVMKDSTTELASASSSESFEYIRKMLVTTFLGTKYENETKFDTKEGPFEDCGAFQNMDFMNFDPNNLDRLYFAGGKTPARIIDFAERYVYIFNTNLDRVNGVDFTKNGDLVMARNQDKDDQTGIYLFTRASNFTERLELCNARTAQAPTVHPIDGRIYWSQYRSGKIYSYDLETEEKAEVCSLPYAREACIIIWHPTGTYCYLMFVQHHCIYRADYNAESKTLDPPYRVVGLDSKYGYEDGVGSSARVNTPRQGVFVKNPDYAGNEDEYDYYFCDQGNHAIRYLTPTGRVYTFAGRADGGPSGYRDGDLRKEALFNKPSGIAYDTKRNCFYIGDNNNNRIRRIGLEE